MYNMNYKESKHMEEVRKKYLKMVEEEPNTEGYLQGLKDMITSAEIGFAIGCILGVVINYLKNNLKNK